MIGTLSLWRSLPQITEKKSVEFHIFREKLERVCSRNHI